MAKTTSMTFHLEEKYITGVESVDMEHRDMVLTLNSIDHDLTYNSAAPELKTHLDLLLRITKRPFRHEEEYLIKTNHPDHEPHRSEHLKLEMELEAILLNNNYRSLVDMLEKWLMNHISTWDLKFKTLNTPSPPEPAPLIAGVRNLYHSLFQLP